MDFTAARWLNRPRLSDIAVRSVSITTEPNTDFWQRSYYGFRNDNAPALLLESGDNFTFTVRAVFHYRQTYDQCGVIIYLDHENWFKASVEFENDDFSRLGSVVTNFGHSDWATTDIPTPTAMWYRLSRRGPDFLIESLPDGTAFKQMRVFHLHHLGETSFEMGRLDPPAAPLLPVSFGLYACSPMDSSFEAIFDSFRLDPCSWAAHASPQSALAIRDFHRNGRSVMIILDAYRRVWHLRWRFLTAHVAMTLFAAAVLSPLVGAMVRLAIGLSGAPALADQDIARFLLSPTGLACAIVVASVLIVAGVLETAVLMWIHMVDRRGARTGVLRGLAPVVRRLPALLIFAALLVGRILIIAAPFLALAALTAWYLLTGHDINYYLSARPPEFIRAAILIAVIAAVMGGLLVERLVSWSVALPGLLFSGFGSTDAFRGSADLTKGHRMRIAARLAAWAALALAIGACVAGAAGGGARFAVEGSGAGFGAVVTFMGFVLVIWFVANMVATTLTAGSLAVLLADQLAWCGAPVTVEFAEDGSAERSAGTFRTAALLLGAAGLAALVMSVSLLADARPADDVAVIAHRGAAGARPENTLASVRKAIEDGADWVEIDVQETKDGEVVVLHDSDFMKISGTDLKIWDATMADLAEIDIGSWFAPEYAGERTPTLAAVLDEARGKARVVIELKYYGHDVRLEERVAEVVEAAGMAESIAVMSLDYAGVRKMKALRPDWRVGLLAATAIGDMTGLEADFLAVSTRLASVHFVRRARAAGRDVYVWTVNDPMLMSRMISRGVAGLITDEPGLAREVLSERSALGAAEQLLLVGADLLGLDLTPRSYRDQSP